MKIYWIQRQEDDLAPWGEWKEGWKGIRNEEDKHEGLEQRVRQKPGCGGQKLHPRLHIQVTQRNFKKVLHVSLVPGGSDSPSLG